MADCLHCEINDLVQSHVAQGDADPNLLASKIVESLADLILSAPKEEQGLFIADVIGYFGQVILEKSGAEDEGSPRATH